MFKVGDTIVHPGYGAGVVTEIKERRSLGSGKRYYSLALLGQPETTVMGPVGNEEKVGLRRPILQSKIGQVWRVLRAAPQELPSNHEKRYALLRDRLEDGDVLRVAETLRDLAWRWEEKRHLTIRGKRLYETSLELLASEVAGAQGSDFETVEAQISKRLAAIVAGPGV